MNNDQPNALRLAALLESLWKYYPDAHKEAAAELRRLHAENEVLREALKACVEGGIYGSAEDHIRKHGRAALARAGETK